MARARAVSETDVIETLVAIGDERFEVNARRVLDCGRPVEFDVLLLADDERDVERRRRSRRAVTPVEIIPATHARDNAAVAAAVKKLPERSRRTGSEQKSSAC
ncbi:MAG: hypothetical protein KY457_00980 [Actinobacteria bacterium]|nr:hypothetical protein [Actinomycetota bacterium]